MTGRCERCGRFSNELDYVWGPIQSSGFDHGACPRCRGVCYCHFAPHTHVVPEWEPDCPTHGLRGQALRDYRMEQERTA